MNEIKNFIKTHKLEIIIFAVALVVRIFLFYINLDANNGDFDKTIYGSDWYYEVSQNLYHGNGFSIDGLSPSPIHVPLYPLFLALSLFLFNGYIFAVVMQIIIGAFIPILALRLSKKIIDSDKISKFVGFFIAIEPNFVFFSFIFFTETLFIFLFLLACLVFMEYIENLNIKYLIIFSIILGASSLIKTVVQFYPIFLIPVMWWFFRKRIGLKKTFLHIGLFLSIFVVVLSPWLYRNYKVFGVPGMTIMPSLNLYVTLVPSVLSIENGVSFNEARKLFISDRNIDVSKLTVHTAPEFNKEAFDVLKKYPLSLLKVSAINVFTFFTHDGMLSVLQYAGFTPKESLSKPAITLLMDTPKEFLKTVWVHVKSPFVLVLLMRIFWGIVTLMFLFGIYLLWHKKKMTAPVVFALVTVLYFVVTTPSNGLTVNSRFRMPVNPIILSVALYPLIGFIESTNKDENENHIHS
ncbi:hypothetical protein COW81_03360 [Candidatus Campbellbacteria bacterium CG22_combo_CG10-13_8_21_14_all_36_13]|uniref:Glycosyltransferase RgtA/B/C/D-like domain-containing protein n=1 Tax=Candidatus Campbellbacteria bacterium CG22_combo_CG10-13_8_21_14_all_36_13 TaxID=1974529 RepID=A0A2H0DXG9_9BACT|nr:MAG: hypothetical protein COW81_03360 [Candidatus Campbellbacteria bacterium CG22_combo_CG10-13_8_21_14_all_36_13]